MEVENLEGVLREHPFFHDLTDDDLAFLVSCAKNERFEVGDYIFREGGNADKVYLLRHGQVSVQVHVPGKEAQVLRTLAEGDILGWSWIVEPYRWTFDAKVTRLARVVSLNAVCLRKKLETNHELGYRLMRKVVGTMADRLHAAQMQMLDVYGSKKEGCE